MDLATIIARLSSMSGMVPPGTDKLIALLRSYPKSSVAVSAIIVIGALYRYHSCSMSSPPACTASADSAPSPANACNSCIAPWGRPCPPAPAEGHFSLDSGQKCQNRTRLVAGIKENVARNHPPTKMCRIPHDFTQKQHFFSAALGRKHFLGRRFAAARVPSGPFCNTPSVFRIFR